MNTYRGENTMRDTKDIIIQFVKIVERHPEIYDHNMGQYRSRPEIEKAWLKIVECIKNELHEKCTVEELRTKWKGIRSSYNRFKNKLYQSSPDSYHYKKYYLYDSLRFLDPFVRPKGIPNQNINQEDNIFDESYNYVDIDERESLDNSDTNEELPSDIKPEIIFGLQENDEDSTKNSVKSDKEICQQSVTKRIKTENNDGNASAIKNNVDNEDMQFFRSILPDIRNFTSKEKRKLKMGIFKLIDEIEDERKQLSSGEEATTS